MNSNPDGQPESFEACYRALSKGGATRAEAARLFGLRHWIHDAGDMDLRTGELLPDGLEGVCQRIRSMSASRQALRLRDRLYRILVHAREPLNKLLRGLHEGLLREHASLPLRAVRELDTSSFFALSRRPGRTVREKLADRPYLWAVERHWTIDTAANRLVKALCTRIVDLLRLREAAVGEGEEPWVDELRSIVEVWLLGPDAKAIKRWENLPPNNLLLQHPDYRRVWTAWSWTETLDDDIRRDHDRRVTNWATVLFWSLVGQVAGSPRARVVEQACYLDYEKFAILPGRTQSPALASVDGLLFSLRDASERGRAFSIELRAASDASARVEVRRAGGPPLEMAVEGAGERVNVRLGTGAATCDLNPATAIEYGTIAAQKLLAADGSQAREPVPGPDVSRAVTCVLDLCLLRPRFATDNEKGTLPLRLLWQHWHQRGREALPLGLGTARAVGLGDEGVDTVSILDLLSANPQHSAATLGQAARSFAATLHEVRPSESLIYLLPDGTDEFALGALRRGVNASFARAEPLPRSIAAAFEWHSSRRFAQMRVREGDCLVVIDSVGDVLSGTPLIASLSQEVADRVSESRGITWERCPSIQAGPECTSVAAAQAVLEEMGCGFAAEVARLCGYQGLVDEGVGLSWQDAKGGWFTPPHAHKQIMERVIRGMPSPWDLLLDGVEQEATGLHRDARVFVLIVGDVFSDDATKLAPRLRGRCEVVPLGAAHEPHAGALALHRWQERAGEIPLWRDRLPQLSMRIIENGRPARFHLVQRTTIQPRRGDAVRIPVDGTFVLPAGEPHYQFPLLQGSEGSELRYEAFLTAPAFPLAEDVPVQLDLSYSYGSDMPYDLVFTNRELGLRVRAEWRQRDADMELPSHYPMLPPADPWSRFERFPKRDSDETTSLLEWIRDNMERVEMQFVGMEAERQSVEVSSSWKPKNSDRRFTFAGQVFVHRSDFVFPEQVNQVEWGTALRMEIEQTDKGLVGRWVTIASADGDGEDSRILCQKLDRLVEYMRKGPRFPFLRVWADGHSLSEPEAPDWFRQVVRRTTEFLLLVLQYQPPDDCPAECSRGAWRLSMEALFLLCCMHCDAPAEAPAALREAIDKHGPKVLQPWRLGRHAAFAVGGGETEWQRELLGEIVGGLRRENTIDGSSPCLQVLGMALWRCPALLARLDKRDLHTIIDQTVLVLNHDVARLEETREAVDPRTLKDHLELVLALLRTRASDDASISALLAPGKPAAKALARAVEKIIDVVSEQEIPVESRLTLFLEKPPALHNTPDLLYALQLYLTGNDGARAIQVLAVKQDED